MAQRMPNGSTPQAGFSSEECRRGTISLRCQLAQDGCAESQLLLAKSLLEETAVNPDDRQINAQIAIHWLLRATEKGNYYALQLLRRCFIANVGINHDNSDLVVRCLQLPEEEIIARRVAFAIYSKIMSDVDESIAEDIFQKKMNLVLTLEETNLDLNTSGTADNCSKFSHAQDLLSDLSEPILEKDMQEKGILDEPLEQQIASKVSPSGDILSDHFDESITSSIEPCISITDVISSVRQCLEGSLPVVTLQHVAQYEEYYKFFSLKYAHKLSNFILNALIRLVTDLGSANLAMSIMIYLLFLMQFDYSILPILNTLEPISFCSLISVVIMISCSCFLIHLHFGLLNVNRWIDLIKLFEPNIKDKEIRQKYFAKKLYPFLIFFAASITFNVLYSVDFIKVITGELVILSIVLMILLDRTITHQRYHVNISLLLNILLCLNKENLCSSEFGLLNYINFKVCLPLYTPFEIHLNWLSCLTLPLVLPYLYWKMAFCSEKCGWKFILFPHFLCLIWLNLATNMFKTCGDNDMIYGIFFWLMVLLLTPFTGTIVSLFMVSIMKSFYLSNSWPNPSVIIAIVTSLFLFFLCFFFIKKLNNIFGSKLVSFAILIIVLIVYLMKSSYVDQTSSTSLQVIPWEKYEIYCHRNAWYRSNTAEVQRACLPLKGKRISIEGTVTEISISAVKNPIKDIFSIFPSFILQWLTSAFGSSYCEKKDLSPFEKDRCQFFDLLNVNNYHLHNWDNYQYQILLEVSSRTSPEVLMKADHTYFPFIKSLKEGDSLNTVGILHASIGGTLPEILLEKATCHTCYENENTHPEVQTDSKSHFDMDFSLRHLVKFYFFPFIQTNN